MSIKQIKGMWMSTYKKNVLDPLHEANNNIC